MFNNLQKIGKSFMLPIAILPAAGLLLGIGGALSNPNTVQTYPVLNIPWLQGIFQIMSSAGDVVFGNLALIMCIGLSVGLAKKDKGTAALAGAVAFLVMNAAIQGMINAFNPNVESIDTGVVGAIVIGSVVSNLHNRYHNIQLPSVLGFFGGLAICSDYLFICFYFNRSCVLLNLADFPRMVSHDRKCYS